MKRLGAFWLTLLIFLSGPALEGKVRFGDFTIAPENAVPRTIGNIIGNAHPDSMIHLTTSTQAELAGGLWENSTFVRLGDVSHMTLAEYQASVVGRAAAGYTSDVTAFIVSKPGAAQFVPWYESGAAGVAEHATVGRLVPETYIPLPKP